MKPIISVVLGSYNRFHFLKLTIKSIREELLCLNHSSEIIVIDGGSDDGALEWLLHQKDIITIVQHNHGTWKGRPIERCSWGYFMNLGFKVAQGKYVCMLSDDCLVIPGAIIKGYKLFEQALNEGRNVGAVAFYWRDWGETDNEYSVYRVFKKYLYVNHGLYLKSAIEYVGYAEEDLYQFYNGDMDLCLKMWKTGYEIIDSKQSLVEHYPHANVRLRKKNSSKQSKDLAIFFDAWWPILCQGQDRSLGYVKEDIIYVDLKKTADVFNRYSLFNRGVMIKKNKQRILGLLRNVISSSIKRIIRHICTK